MRREITQEIKSRALALREARFDFRDIGSRNADRRVEAKFVEPNLDTRDSGGIESPAGNMNLRSDHRIFGRRVHRTDRSLDGRFLRALRNRWQRADMPRLRKRIELDAGNRR